MRYKKFLVQVTCTFKSIVQIIYIVKNFLKNMNFGKRLKEVLIWKGISQTEFSKMIGLRKSNITNWIHNRSYPNLKLFVKICILLDETPNYFLDFHE